MAQNKTRAQALLENFDDVITGMMQQMDAFAQESGGYMNRMHPDQYSTNTGMRKDDTLISENQRKYGSRRVYR